MTQNRYTVVVGRSAAKSLRCIPEALLDRIQERMTALGEDPFPHGYQKLQGYEAYYRIRVGDYRIIYEINNNLLIVTVIRIGHRRNIYVRL